MAKQVAREMYSIIRNDDSVHGWVTRRMLRQHGLTPRECRLGCEGANGRIIFGQKGYKLTSRATRDERRVCLREIRSRITARLDKEAALKAYIVKLETER